MKGRKVFMVRSDMEGLSGVTSYEEVTPGAPGFAYGQRMMMADLLALLEGLNEGGADEIVIYDEHFFGRNILPDELPDNVSVICGKPPYRPDWAGGLNESFTGMVMLGFHSKAGTPNGLLHHTYEPDIGDIRINGRSVGEIGVETTIAGELGIPLLLLTGDSAGVAEALELVPECLGVSVKQSICEWGAECYPLKLTTARIREAGRKVAAAAKAPQPFHFGQNIVMEIDLRSGAYRTLYEQMFAEDMIAAGIISLSGSSVLEAWAEYWDKKLKVQKMEVQNER
ncbi:M55 family metallopeptidase [Paenibacillus sp. WQ 127069]|uniref:M55 family metallopeptidase n=1 Tax=Paenibacillus baimaensis TaxID=2982185 RepID=A0ABT2UD72_9BACL|nr:M55 family metallopeptidase [Paenibacillus sp. WQ 127069]MCU6792575.1 M55 family metallopeptidase [Paenibacillus sp. WQ 127069]